MTPWRVGGSLYRWPEDTTYKLSVSIMIRYCLEFPRATRFSRRGNVRATVSRYVNTAAWKKHEKWTHFLEEHFRISSRHKYKEKKVSVWGRCCWSNCSFHYIATSSYAIPWSTSLSRKIVSVKNGINKAFFLSILQSRFSEKPADVFYNNLMFEHISYGCAGSLVIVIRSELVQPFSCSHRRRLWVFMWCLHSATMFAALIIFVFRDIRCTFTIAHQIGQQTSSDILIFNTNFVTAANWFEPVCMARNPVFLTVYKANQLSSRLQSINSNSSHPVVNFWPSIVRLGLTSFTIHIAWRHNSLCLVVCDVVWKTGHCNC